MQLNPLLVTLVNLASHLNRLWCEGQRLSEQEITVMLILRGLLVQNGLGQTQLMKLLEQLLARQKNSKSSEESASRDLSLPQSSCQRLNNPELDNQLSVDLVALLNLRQQRQQKRQRKKVEVEVEVS